MDSSDYDDPIIAEQAAKAQQNMKAKNNKKPKCTPKGQKFDSAQFEKDKQLGKQCPT